MRILLRQTSTRVFAYDRYSYDTQRTSYRDSIFNTNGQRRGSSVTTRATRASTRRASYAPTAAQRRSETERDSVVKRKGNSKKTTKKSK